MSQRRSRIPRPRARKKKSGARGSRTSRLLLRGLLVLAVAGVLAGAAGLAWLWPRCSGAECPSVEGLRSYTPPQASRIFDAEGRVLAHLAPERRIVVPLERMPRMMVGAFLAVEDKRFFSHAGVDYRRVGGAMLRNARSGRFAEGFSTITMQLARNVFPDHLTREKTLRRKLWEVVIARDIERSFSKDEILEMYLNQIYLGDGYYGVEAAAQGYFGRAAREVTAEEAALLASLPKAPTFYNPRRNPEPALERRNLVLSLMAEGQVIGDADAAQARQVPLKLAPPTEALGEAPFFVAAVRRELRERFGPEAETAGLRVYTALDPAMQRSGQREIAAQLAAIEAGQHGRFGGPKCATQRPADGSGCLQGLFVAMDPLTGDVRALVGGRDFALSQFDRATQARRQAGSAFKPIVFATALGAGIAIPTALLGPGAADYESGYRPADHVADSVPIDLREALRMSSNRAAVVLGERVGVGNVVQTAKSMGLSTPIHAYPSTVLGASDVIPIELVAAFTAFANGGTQVAPRLIRRVTDAQGRLVYEAPVMRRAAISPEAAFLTVNLMKDVVNRGTGNGARTAGLPYSVPAAGKTGTTNEAADVWFVGVTPDLAAGVWFGYDQPKRIMVGASGGRLAAPVWGRVLAEHYRGRAAPADWAPPAGVTSVEIDVTSGMLAGSQCPHDHVRSEWFLRGTEPLEYCRLHPEPGLDGWFRRTVRGIGDWIGGGRGND
jgi:penicillin-binding protein 1A